MASLNTKEGLLETLQAILSMESLARGWYAEDIESFSHPKLVQEIEQIRADEDKHIAILTELVGILESAIP